jgi:UDP:flavonoid glycosyltransferase YjiC (YdhE family)
MVNRNRQEIDAIVRQALDQTGNRGIILSGWSQVKSPSSEQIIYLDAVAHDRLLPHCKMIIHHGGAGTTSAGLRAGIPNVIIPFTADQPFWGRRVHTVGAGPVPIPVKKLSTQRLVQAIREAETGVCREQAQSSGQKVRSEDGVGKAIGLIEMYSNEFHTRCQ